MKKLFVSIIAVAALAACAKEELVSVNQEAIEFGGPFVENATRADYSSTDINTINVYGTVNNVLIYDYTPVTRPSNVDGEGYNDNWTCNVKQYWIEGATYKFAALVDVPKANITPDQYGMPASFTYTADGQTDVLYDYYTTTGKAKDQNTTVPFTFKHLLSKVYFTVSNLIDDSKYTYTISEVTLLNTRPDGTYTVYTTDNGTGAWAAKSALANTAFDPIEDVAFGTDKTNTALLLIPTETTKVGVSFKVTLSISGEEVSSYTYSKADVTTLAQNNVYNFNISLSDLEQINFTVTAKPQWTSPENEPAL